MNRLIYLSVAIFLLLSAKTFAQQKDTNMRLTLKQAQDYALQNSPVIKNANIDLESAKKKVWETTAMGLPQVNSKLAYSYMLTIPSIINEFSGLSNLGPWMYGVDQALAGITHNPGFGHIPYSAPTAAVSENDMKWGLTYDVTATQLLFSGSYIVGLQTAKTFTKLSEISITKSQNDLMESVSNAYFLELVLKQNLKIVDSLYSNTEKITKDITAMQQKGFVEETDVDQLNLTLANISNTKEMLSRQCEVAANLLKFQLGVELTSKVDLADDLENLIKAVNVETISKTDFKLENNPDFKLLDASVKMAELNVKFQKAAFLPDVAAYYMHDESFNKNAFVLTPPNSVGISATIPIFGSGMKIARVQQAKLGLQKMKNQQYQAGLGLQMQFADARSSYINALQKYNTNKLSVALAEKIYNKSLIKYKAGTISSLELTQAQTQYLQAQSALYTTVIEMSSAYSKLEKLLK